VKQHNFSSALFCILASVFAGLATAPAAAPYDTATVTRVENKATVAEIKGGQAADAHPAAVHEVIHANSFLQTSGDGRAELEFRDKSLVRVGPNSVFSFESSSRTVSLQKGSMLFYLPHGKGGVKVKTAALTAALTGTVLIVSGNDVALASGRTTLKYTNLAGEEKTLVLEAGDGNNAATFDPATGEFIPYHLDFSNSSNPLAAAGANLASWAVLPANAQIEIATNSPSLTDAIAEAAANAAPGGGESVYGNISPLFSSWWGGGGGAAAAGTTTRVLADGSIGIFDSLGNLVGVQ
jgi:hypothetical protein